jgi:hypothetical protein
VDTPDPVLGRLVRHASERDVTVLKDASRHADDRGESRKRNAARLLYISAVEHPVACFSAKYEVSPHDPANALFCRRALSAAVIPAPSDQRGWRRCPAAPAEADTAPLT